MKVKIGIAPEKAIDGVGRPTDVGVGPLRARVAEAVVRGGGEVVPLAEAEGLVWLLPGGPQPLLDTLDAHPDIRWVQLPWAGVEHFGPAFTRPQTFTCAKGSFAKQVSEHALMLILACLRDLVRHARTPSWLPIDPRSLGGRSVTILGGGGIATELIALLQPFGCRVTALRRSSTPVPGADVTLPLSSLHSVLPSTEVLVVALALTPETRHVVGAPEFALLPEGAVLVNVARGGHVDTEALVAAVDTGRLGAAGLDVTSPEPLPDGHPLWSRDRVLVTSHCADSSEYVAEMLCARIAENVRRFGLGKPLEGLVDAGAGY
ncbi:D-isomer specific 2-hydroxyacid dehydrogenase family protein [Actinocorallia sp. API 0066]|uniref:D-isomer specific 2-hydroxyacid dehydrogenase family protein n=1 Tax=Actinocorallia sp. API 0066 TaxID=2896846 RepID=UPI001E4F37D9|nr:D-isomer specific 2-hydroxyacid dehydrogenase family protein [Actinocorallia sp. API 0066]MCD0447962.1 D-isomer specific 2-hydroxyacid dehydrogenase family protein [Actinocorallia sp. API 0066]